MTTVRGRLDDERGLVGKILVLWLILLVLVGIVTYDGVQIALARFRAADAAQTASFEAASTLRLTKNRKAALDAAKTVADQKDVRLTGFKIDPSTGQVTVTTEKHAPTIVVGKLLLKDLAVATARDTSEPPTGP